MKLSLKVVTCFGLHPITAGLLMLPVGCAVFVVWQEQLFREQITRAIPAMVAVAPEPVRLPLNATAVVTVFGLTTDDSPRTSAEPLTLQASFVVSNGLSRALLADAQGSRLYQVGERLPGGSVLRRVEASQVMLWNKGREELLTLQSPAVRFLRRFESSTEPQAPVVSARYLRPFSGPSE
ncbi:type II secretion system protein N [Pseudomonas sp. NFX224]|uniref:type II secretion system protein N n=1 Tax=Pseudomonas sp. NFX224 TaxID=3402862 RepID=UPI003AFA87A7